MRCPGFLTVLFLLTHTWCAGQRGEEFMTLPDADSGYVRKAVLKNDLRLFYGGQGNNISLGSTRDDGTRVNGDLYKNTNDYIGAGITYGWLDGDLSFSLPGTAYLKEERSNLTQFKLAFGYTRRKVVYRWYYTESTGVVISGSNNEFESTPSLHEVRWGMQVILLFNPAKYSYRAAMYQSEYQMKTAGSFLLRFDPFYRDTGTKSGSMIPADFDRASRFGDQAGLEYIHAPGLVVMPGYGINIAIRNTYFFISPMAFAGVGLAQNNYQSANGKGSITNVEYAANFILNAGYNGSRYYSKVLVNWSTGYTALSPTYMTSANLTITFTGGIRFRNLGK